MGILKKIGRVVGFGIAVVPAAAIGIGEDLVRTISGENDNNSHTKGMKTFGKIMDGAMELGEEVFPSLAIGLLAENVHDQLKDKGKGKQS